MAKKNHFIKEFDRIRNAAVHPVVSYKAMESMERTSENIAFLHPSPRPRLRRK